MSGGMKALNVLGIIVAWILSIILVVLLFISPVLLSTLSVVTPENLKKTVTSIEIPDLIDAMDIEGIDSENDQLQELLSSNAVQEAYEAYMDGVFGVLEGDSSKVALTEEKLQEIVHNNIDELYEIVAAESPDLADLPEEEAKKAVETMLSESMSELMAQLPSPESLVQEMEGQSSEMDTALEVLKNMDTIKFSFIAVLVVLSGLIFVCRLFEFRGIRWLSVDLFVATGFAALVCIALSLGTSMIEMLVSGSPVAGLFAGELMSSLVSGVYIRTGVMLLAAVGLLVAYIFIKKNRKQKAAAQLSAAAIDAPVEAAVEEAVDTPTEAEV